MKVHIPSLDGVRGLAVLMVVAVHYGNLANRGSSILGAIQTIKDMGWVGVDVFFVLSGFLITGILWEAKRKPHPWKNFYARRALRLFPLYYAVWFFLLGYLFLAHLSWHYAYLGYLSYFGNIASIQISNVGPFHIDHFWSLAVEEQFYLLWPFVLWKVEQATSAMHILVGLALFSVVLKLLLLLAHVNGNWAYILLPSHMEGLALGSLLALSVRTPGHLLYLQKAARCLPLVLIALGAEAIHFHGLNYANPSVTLLAIPLLSLASTLLLINCLTAGSVTQKIMEAPVLRFYGKYSYGLYIYHFLLREVLHDNLYLPLRSLHGPILSGSIYFLICIILLTGLSVASFELFENRFLLMKLRFNT
jgi:peptidoglycan/LPS O-acetylase OafA/YrhL